jgi:hypothetical protein
MVMVMIIIILIIWGIPKSNNNNIHNHKSPAIQRGVLNGRGIQK